jgi:hypothetical protein
MYSSNAGVPCSGIACAVAANAMEAATAAITGAITRLMGIRSHTAPTPYADSPS